MFSKVIGEYSSEALERYFKHLENTGYEKDRNVMRLIALSFVESLLNSEMNAFISEENYKLISDFLYCMFGSSCLLPYPAFIEEIPVLGTIIPDMYGITEVRLTEDDLVRFLEKGNVRLMEH